MTITRCLVPLGLVVLLFQAGSTPRAQTPAQSLSTAKTLKCQFVLLATGTWAKSGESQAEIKPAALTLGFEEIDVQDGTAEVSGSFGAPYIIVRYAGGYLHFMQVGSSGFLYATTVFDKASRPGRLKAVHTRHEYTEASVPGYTSKPEQYYGECQIGN